MSLSHLWRRVEALKRKLAPELAIISLRPLAEEISILWAIAVARKQPPPDPIACVRKVADAGFRLKTYMAFYKYLERCRYDNRQPCVRKIIAALLPWAAGSRYLPLLQWDATAGA